MQIKQDNVASVPVRLVRKSDGEGLSGVTHTNVSIYQSKAGAAPAYRALAADEWYEPSAANMPGIYWLRLRAADTNVPGFLVFSVTQPNAITFAGLVEVLPALAEDAKASADAAKVSADLAAERAGDAVTAIEEGGGSAGVFYLG